MNDAESLYRHGVELYDQGDIGGAFVAYEKALVLNPLLASAHNGRGAVLTARGQRGEAMKEFELAIELDPNLGKEPRANPIGFCDDHLTVSDSPVDCVTGYNGARMASAKPPLLLLHHHTAHEDQALTIHTHRHLRFLFAGSTCFKHQCTNACFPRHTFTFVASKIDGDNAV